jgi:hypothetical protein
MDRALGPSFLGDNSLKTDVETEQPLKVALEAEQVLKVAVAGRWGLHHLEIGGSGQSAGR